MSNQVVVGYGPDGQECQPSIPKCIAQARLREDGPAHYVRSFGAELVDPAIYPRYADIPFVKVTEACFKAFHHYLTTRKAADYLAADRAFREWN